MLVLPLHSNLMLKFSLIARSQYDLMIMQKWFTFYWATL